MANQVNDIMTKWFIQDEERAELEEALEMFYQLQNSVEEEKSCFECMPIEGDDEALLKKLVKFYHPEVLTALELKYMVDYNEEDEELVSFIKEVYSTLIVYLDLMEDQKYSFEQTHEFYLVVYQFFAMFKNQQFGLKNELKRITKRLLEHFYESGSICLYLIFCELQPYMVTPEMFPICKSLSEEMNIEDQLKFIRKCGGEFYLLFLKNRVKVGYLLNYLSSNPPCDPPCDN